MKLIHPREPENTIDVNEDQVDAYLASGWLPKPAKDSNKS